MSGKTIENITVSVRIRPLFSRELSSGDKVSWEAISDTCIKDLSGARSFTYDKVYPESIPTSAIFSYQGLEVIEKCLEGFNGCIFCYGQTGSGKTHTMHGTRKISPGLVPMSIEHIFTSIQLSSQKEFLIRCSYLEIYNESINDLLNPSSLNLQLAEDKKVSSMQNGIKILGATEEICSSATQVNSLLVLGEKHKNIASTNFNQRSSRSHSIFRVVVESKTRESKANVLAAALNLIDLAGSESADVHGPKASSTRSKEMKYINRSLLTLGTVIMRLSDKKNSAPIPYRDSKLTRILQSALEGDSKVSIICNISSSSQAFDETLSTLKFANRAKKIKQVIVKNTVKDSKTLIVKYERQISELQEKLREMEQKMVHEENVVAEAMVSNQILVLQEEKEKSEARVECILQEKLKLQEELERLKSFIVCADNVKTPVNPIQILLAKRNAMASKLAHSKTMHHYVKKKTNESPVDMLKVPQSDFAEDKKNFDERESLLINGIENIEDDLVEDSPVGRLSLVVPGFENNEKIGLSTEDYCKIIDKQAVEIEELQASNQGLEEARLVIEEQNKFIDEQNKLIEELKAIIEDKDEKFETLNDELKLYKNNLRKIQDALKLTKFLGLGK